MERRIHSRLPANIPVQITELAERENSGSGTIIDISQSGVCVRLGIQFSPGSLVEIELDDSLLFGQIAHVSQDKDQFRTGIYVEQVLLGTSNLTRLLQGVLQQHLPNTKGLNFHNADAG